MENSMRQKGYKENYQNEYKQALCGDVL